MTAAENQSSNTISVAIVTTKQQGGVVSNQYGHGKCNEMKTQRQPKSKTKYLAEIKWFMRRYFAENVGVCSMPCGIGQYMEHDQNYVRAKCCWTCRKCPVGNIVVNNTCVECKNTEFPDEQHTRCLSLPVKAITWG